MPAQQRGGNEEDLTEIRNSVILTRICTFCQSPCAYPVHFRFPSVVKNNKERLMPLCKEHYEKIERLPEVNDVPWYLK